MPQTASKKALKKVVAIAAKRSNPKPGKKARRALKKAVAAAAAVKQIEGHGKYKSKGIGKAAGSALGTAAATALGLGPLAPLAGMAGGFLGDLAEGGLGEIISRIFGSGAYTEEGAFKPGAAPLHGSTQGNSILDAAESMGHIPERGSHVEFSMAPGGWVRLVKRELVGDVLSSTSAYSVAYTLPLTPCNAQMNPWVAQVANLFQEYTYKGICFEFLSLTSPTLVSGVPGIQTGGYVGFATQLNPELAAPGDKVTALELQSSQTNAPWVSQLHPVECAESMTNQPHLFVEGRSGVPAGSSPALYRHGTTYVIVGEQPSAGVKMGEVWSSVEVWVRFPSLDNPLPVNAHYSLSMPTAGPFGTPASQPVLRTGALSGISVTDTTITFPVSRGSDRWYFVSATHGNNVLASANYNMVISSMAANISTLIAFSNFSSNAETNVAAVEPNTADTRSRSAWQWVFKVNRLAANTAANNSVVFAMTGPSPATPEFGDLFICEMAGPDQAAGLASTLRPVEMKRYVEEDVQREQALLRDGFSPTVDCQLAVTLKKLKQEMREEFMRSRCEPLHCEVAGPACDSDSSSEAGDVEVKQAFSRTVRGLLKLWMGDHPEATPEQCAVAAQRCGEAEKYHDCGIMGRADNLALLTQVLADICPSKK